MNIAKIAKKLLDKGETSLAQEVLALEKQAIDTPADDESIVSKYGLEPIARAIHENASPSGEIYVKDLSRYLGSDWYIPKADADKLGQALKMLLDVVGE